MWGFGLVPALVYAPVVPKIESYKLPANQARVAAGRLWAGLSGHSLCPFETHLQGRSRGLGIGVVGQACRCEGIGNVNDRMVQTQVAQAEN